MNNVSLGRAAFVTILAMVAFWLAGWIGNFWTCLAILGAIAVIVLCQRISPTADNSLNTLSKVFLVWLIWTAGLPMIQQAMNTSMPMTSQALGDRGIYEDLQISESVRPSGLEALMGYRNMLDGVDDGLGIKISQRCDYLRQQYLSGAITSANFQQQVAQIGVLIQNHRQWRNNAGALITSIPTPSMLWLASIQNTPPREIFWLLGLAVTLAALVGSYGQRPRLLKAVWAAAVFFALLFVGDKLLWGNLIGTIQSMISGTPNQKLFWIIGIIVLGLIAIGVGKSNLLKGTLAAVTILGIMLLINWMAWGGGINTLAQAQTGRQGGGSSRQPSTISVQINPVTWSNWIVVPFKANCHTPGWQEFWFSTGEKIRVEKNGSMTMTLPNGTVQSLSAFPDPTPSITLRIRGEAGTATFSPI